MSAQRAYRIPDNPPAQAESNKRARTERREMTERSGRSCIEKQSARVFQNWNVRYCSVAAHSDTPVPLVSSQVTVSVCAAEAAE
jgi:hypothetical protein